ncbi:hypothetical protein V9K67_17655 [Paraflavisolibacter sp. H34]|uniref:hypothetical protein n=1 Tax=Huijunlia imazamoxiresistens TaxID=3127457 RepID=UPI00301A906C
MTIKLFLARTVIYCTGMGAAHVFAMAVFLQTGLGAAQTNANGMKFVVVISFHISFRNNIIGNTTIIWAAPMPVK